MRYPAPKIDTAKIMSALADTIKERGELIDDLKALEVGLADTPYHEEKLRTVIRKEYRECFERLVEIDTRLYAVDVLLYVT